MKTIAQIRAQRLREREKDAEIREALDEQAAFSEKFKRAIYENWKGDRGDKGDPGEQGPSGRDGRDGVDGRDGLHGLDGLPGANGRDGEPGPSGPPGAPGQRGEKGPPGKDGRDGRDAPRPHRVEFVDDAWGRVVQIKTWLNDGTVEIVDVIDGPDGWPIGLEDKI